MAEVTEAPNDLRPGEAWPESPAGALAYLKRRIDQGDESLVELARVLPAILADVVDKVDALEHFVRVGLNAGAHLDQWFHERELQKAAQAAAEQAPTEGGE